MRIAVISDTHGLHSAVPDMPKVDLFIHAGDFMNHGQSMKEVLEFAYWVDRIPIPKDRKFVCAGNHDILFDYTHRMSNPEVCIIAERELHKVCTYMNEESVIVDGIKMYFSPWTPRFFNWAFNADRGEDIKKHWENIPEDVDILITHGPPYGVLDKIKLGDVTFPNLGCEELAKRVKHLKNLKYHVFGHIHGSRGNYTPSMPFPTFVNASFLTERYIPHQGSGYFVLEI